MSESLFTDNPKLAEGALPEVATVGNMRRDINEAALLELSDPARPDDVSVAKAPETKRRFATHDGGIEFQQDGVVPEGTNYLGVEMVMYGREGQDWWDEMRDRPRRQEDREYLRFLGGYGYATPKKGPPVVVPLEDADTCFVDPGYSAPKKSLEKAIAPSSSFTDFVLRMRDEATGIFTTLQQLPHNAGVDAAFFAATGERYTTIDVLVADWTKTRRENSTLSEERREGPDSAEYIEMMLNIKKNVFVVNFLPEVVRLRKENDDLRGVLANTQRRLQQIHEYERIVALIGWASHLENPLKVLFGKSFGVQNEGGEEAFFAHLVEEFSPDNPIDEKTLPSRIQEVERGIVQGLKVLLEQQMHHLQRGRFGARYEFEGIRRKNGRGNWEGVLACTRKHIFNKGSRGNISVDLGEAVSGFLDIEGGRELVERAILEQEGISPKKEERKG